MHDWITPKDEEQRAQFERGCRDLAAQRRAEAEELRAMALDRELEALEYEARAAELASMKQPVRTSRPTSTIEPRADEVRDGWEGYGVR